jgi:hypothetical protein
MDKAEVHKAIDWILDPNTTQKEVTKFMNDLVFNSPNEVLFRKLNIKEEQEFRDWARNHIKDLATRQLNSTLSVCHPIVRDEWEKIKKEIY